MSFFDQWEQHPLGKLSGAIPEEPLCPLVVLKLAWPMRSTQATYTTKGEAPSTMQRSHGMQASRSARDINL